jgi:hypothetical protein
LLIFEVEEVGRAVFIRSVVCPSPITNHQSPITNHQSSIINHPARKAAWF